MNQTKVNPYMRSVSIIGVGCTPFMYTVDQPETNGLTEGELYGYAALKAMEDAGVNPQDIDFYFHGEASPLNGSNYLTPNIQIANWFGMKGKASIHHSEACCTGYYAVEQAVNAVASGKYNCVLSGCVEFGDSLAVPDHPYKREKMTMDKFLQTTAWLYDRNYTRSLMAGQELIYDDAAEWYKRTRGLTDEQMDDTLIHMSLNNRKNASMDELAIERRPYEELAKEAGYDNVMDYMRSPYNPKNGDFLRMSGIELKCDGAAAVIVCATELVDKYMGNKSHPAIEVLGAGCAACEATTPHFEVRATEEAVRQVYEVTGVKPEELDLFYANDFIITSHLVSAEIAGYLPYGEGWKYICEGRTAYDGDKPINTNGGRTSFGHAHAASGLADLYEAVKQMRGECGERQVKKLPKTAMLRGYGGAQNICTYIIRTLDGPVSAEEAEVKDSPVKLEKVVEEFYSFLEEGRIMGRKCPVCGAVEFPPVYACNSCGSLATEWVEISGKAKMHSIVMPAPLSNKPAYKALGKFAYGEIELEEGSRLNAVVRGITKKTRKDLLDKLPLDVHAAIFQRDGYKTVVFDLDEKYL